MGPVGGWRTRGGWGSGVVSTRTCTPGWVRNGGSDRVGSLGNLERTPDRVWPPAAPPRSVVDAAAFDALDDPALQEEEHHHQWGDRDGRSHEQLVQVDALRREERRQRDLHRPGALVLPDDQRPQERVPGADERESPDSGDEPGGVGDDHPPERPPVAETVQPGRLLDLPGEAQEV